MRMKHSFIYLFCLLLVSGLQAQVGINILQPDSSAILHLESTDRGFLPPRMDTPQRDAINNPKPGLTIYNTEGESLEYYTGTCWLPVWQENCDDCIFDMEITADSATIDRIYTDTAGTDIMITQTNGPPTPIGLVLLSNLPQGITATLDNPVVNGSGTVHLTVEASIFSPPGTYVVIVQALCGSTTKSEIFVVIVEPCIDVNLLASQVDYDLQAANNLPTATPICVVAHLFPSVEVTSAASSNPAFVSGALHPDSHVGIDNQGVIIGRGGDGGVGGNLTNFGEPGEDGAHAVSLSVKTSIMNNGYLLGGGGGGGSVGIGISIPILGTYALGGGGGGGAGGGLGGNAVVVIPIFEAGDDGGTGITGTGGDGGNYTLPISINVGATVTITPNIQGGDGGDYGIDGQEGNLFVNVDVSVPFIGSIFNQDFPDPPVSSFPAGGIGGNAIKRNGNILIGLPDGNYQTQFVKGKVD